MRLGSTQTSTFIAGIAGTNVSGATVEVNTTIGQLGVSGLSSARYKRDIAAMGRAARRCSIVNELQRQREALKSQQQVLERQQQELTELRALVRQGRDTGSLSR